MSIEFNAQMCAYVRALFEHPSKWYESYQENGTKYLKSRMKLDEQLQEQLNACAGEIFLCGIPPDIKAEKIAEVASLVGEVYILRFKVHFSGASRGFAYLQYMDPNIMDLALKKLPILFNMLHLRTIKVCTSRNSSKLLLRRAFNMSPMIVTENLSKLISFSRLIVRELSPGYFEYQIVFKCNEEAVHARREILKSILKFGPNAVIVWDNPSRPNNYNFKLKRMKENANSKMEFPFKQRNAHAVNTWQQTPAYSFHQNVPLQNNTFVNDFGNLKLF